jgi:DNA-3-methyladenine glycosylase I
MAKTLKKLGFRFFGPTTAYAAMQACGLVDDHLATCPVTLARS